MDSKTIERCNESDTGEGWQSVDLAYDLAMASYGLVQDRLASVESRIQGLLASAATITFAAPVLIAATRPPVDDTSMWFIGAVLAFGLTMVLGTCALAFGSLRAIDPMDLYSGWLHDAPADFKRELVYWAGRHFDVNVSSINRKGNAAIGVTVLFTVELACLVAWAAKW